MERKQNIFSIDQDLLSLYLNNNGQNFFGGENSDNNDNGSRGGDYRYPMFNNNFSPFNNTDFHKPILSMVDEVIGTPPMQ